MFHMLVSLVQDLAIYMHLTTCPLLVTIEFQGEKNKPELRGVIPNSFEHIFSHIARTENQQYLVRASYLEIYMVIKMRFQSFLMLIRLCA